MKKFKIIFFFCGLSLFMAGCKILIQVPVGGEVISQSGAYQCDPSNPCDIDVLEATFNETFQAIAGPGFEFDVWKQQDRYFCGNTQEPCLLSTLLFAGFDVLLEFLKTDEVFYLSPVFKVLPGTVLSEYEGSWQATNTLSELAGDFSLTLADLGEDLVRVTLDLDAFTGGLFDPDEQSVVAIQQANGDITFSGKVDIDGQTSAMDFTLDTAGNLTVTFPDLPQEFLVSATLAGSLNSEAQPIELVVTYAVGARMEGIVSVRKI